MQSSSRLVLSCLGVMSMWTGLDHVRPMWTAVLNLLGRCSFVDCSTAPFCNCETLRWGLEIQKSFCSFCSYDANGSCLMQNPVTSL